MRKFIPAVTCVALVALVAACGGTTSRAQRSTPAPGRRTTVPPSSSAPPPSPTAMCASLDPALQAAQLGSAALEQAAGQALTDGCVAYVATSSSPSKLDLEFIRGPLIGTAVIIGSVATASAGVELTDIALTSAGVLYGVDFGSDLYTINPTTAQATLVGPVNAVVNGLVAGPTGTMYASGGSNLFTVDTASGSGTTIGATGYGSAGDLAFTYDGTLFMTASAGGTSDSLATLNPTSGLATLIGPTGQAGVWGLVSSYGTLFAQTSGGNLVTVNPATGAATVLAVHGPSANGMTAPPPTAATSSAPSSSSSSSSSSSASSTPPPSANDPGSKDAATAAAETWYAKGTNFCRANPPGNPAPSTFTPVQPSDIPIRWTQFTPDQGGAGQAGDASTAGPGSFTATYQNGSWTFTPQFDFC